MDSVTHALYRAVSAQNEAQRKAAHALGQPREVYTAGLQPFANRPVVHEAFAGAEALDLHIALETCDELLALQLEFLAAGLGPPSTMYTNGADVIIHVEGVEIHVPLANGSGTWVANLYAKPGARTVWKEEVI